MRKLVLFSMLGGCFVVAVFLESLATKPPLQDPGHDLVVRLGGGIPQVPEEPPRDEHPLPESGGEASPAKGGSQTSKESPPVLAKEPESKTSEKAKTHVVKSGESLSMLAAKYLGSSERWKELAQWNNIHKPEELGIGDTIFVEPPAKGDAETSASASGKASGKRIHEIAQGETLQAIANLYLGDAARWKEIQQLNKIADPRKIREGTKLEIPGQ